MVVRDRLADTKYEPGAATPFAIDLAGRTKGGLRQIPVDPQRLAIVAIVRGAESTRIYQAAYGEPTR
jgi:hypothetical protein